MKDVVKKEKSDNRKNIPPINDHIVFNRLQLITNDGRNLGVVAKRDALQLATLEGLDLVLLSEQGSEGVPVAKIMDYGKMLYGKKKKASETKKHQKIIQVKEVKLRPKIAGHDFETKMRQALSFLKEGKHVKITSAFRGREIATKEERGSQLFQKIDEFFHTHFPQGVEHEKDAKMGQLWSRTYLLKTSK